MRVRSSLASILLVLTGLLLAPALEARTFRYATESDVASMDPYASNGSFTAAFHHNIYEPLVRYNARLELEPALAKSWELINPITWRFSLRRGVRFHNGNIFNADDVIFSFERARAEGSSFAPIVAPIALVRKVDAYTVELITQVPMPTLLNSVARWYIMDKEWAKAYGAELPGDPPAGPGNFALQNANGTGPFMLDERDPGEQTSFEANDKWWDEPRHNLERVVFRPIESEEARREALVSGDLSLAFPLRASEVEQVEQIDGVRVLRGPEVRTIFLGMDQFRDRLLYSDASENNPFKDLRVRRAIYQAIDIKAIHDRVMRGASTPTGLLIGPSVSGFNRALNERLPFDPAGAKALLAEAGYPDGFSVVLDCPDDRYVNDAEICQAVAEMLGEIGVRVTPVTQSQVKFFKKLLNADVSFYLLGWTPEDLDAGSVIRDLLIPPHEGGVVWNAGRYGDPRITRLSRRIENEVDSAKRQAMIDQCFRIMQDQVGYIPLHQQALAWGVRDGVNLAQPPDNALHYWTVRME